VEPVPVQQFAFQGGEEALAQGVVIGVSDGSHRGANPGLPAPFAELERSVLAALVGVVDHPQRVSLPDGHVKRVQDQLRP
jgi:hypothetical protein